MFSRISFASFEPATPAPTDSNDDSVFVLEPRLLGIGCDRIIGGSAGARYRVIDLSNLQYPVEIIWERPGCGTITDGADSIVFQDIELIILPACMATGDVRAA